MSEFLLEIFSEEIPARMQEKASKDLVRLVTEKLTEADLEHSCVSSYVTARRLTLHIANLSTEQPDVSEERRGPRFDAPDQAVEGFLRGCGVTRDDLFERVDKKGTFFYASIEQKGRAAADVISEFLPGVIQNFPWPKSQRWGTGSLRWVRPLHSILCIHGGKVVNFEVNGILSSNMTRGHRFMAPMELLISSFADYKQGLKKAYVIIDRNERIATIQKDANKLASDNGLDIIDDKQLLNEVAGLTEYPVTMIGSYEEDFLTVPPEALTSAMRTHQKYFSLKDKNDKLTNKFIFVSNINTEDNGAKIIAGNERVLHARLSDTKFFWDQDLKSTLTDHITALNKIVFQSKLGTVGQRIERLETLSGFIATLIGADVQQSKLAAKLSKSDLVTGMVDECPELQGLMGKYFALSEGQDAAVAEAIADQYSPKGPSDNCPSSPVSMALALAEKIDILVGFFGINEKPTGSKDPFALRRASLGIIRLVIENNIRIDLSVVINYSVSTYMNFNKKKLNVDDLLNFFWDRLKIYAKDKNISHDIIGAEFSWDFVKLLAKANSLQSFIYTDDGKNLLAGYKRATNILHAEEKKARKLFDGKVSQPDLSMDEEIELYKALQGVDVRVAAAIKAENFAVAMKELSSLRSPIDEFLNKVTVNSDVGRERENRLKLLSHIRSTMNVVAQFSKIEG
ncbi:MAG: glycine--tRNA ligase subunit beta [Emcibacteraceae bacterium]